MSSVEPFVTNNFELNKEFPCSSDSNHFESRDTTTNLSSFSLQMCLLKNEVQAKCCHPHIKQTCFLGS